MTPPDSFLESFDHGDDVIYVHAYRSVTNGWHLGFAVVASRDGDRTTMRTIACDQEASFGTRHEATRAGERLARNGITRRSS